MSINGTQLKTSPGKPVIGNAPISLPYQSRSYTVHSGDVVRVAVNVPLPPVGPTEAVAVAVLRCRVLVDGKTVKTNSGPAKCSASYTMP
jgi:hypothetical protein